VGAGDRVRQARGLLAEAAMSNEADILAVRGMMKEFARACIERDTAALEELVDDSFTLTDPTGAVIAKEEWLADIASGALVIEAVESESFDARPFEDGCRVKGKVRIAAKSAKRAYEGTFTYLGVYKRAGDGWKLTLSSAKRV
jgi:Domain of unknown function (DUF4440)